MADFFSIVDKMLSKGTDTKFLEDAMHWTAAQIQVPVMIFLLVFGILIVIWIVKGARDESG